MDLNTYTISNIVAADAETAALIGNDQFLFNLNPFDYSPLRPTLSVPLQNIEIFDLPWVDSLVNPIDFEAPISAIRIRLAGVDEFNEASQIRVATVVQEIYDRTGLTAELIIGSSLVDIPVTLTQLDGAPDLHLSERWSQAGVAGVIVDAVDQKSVLLFTLILASGILTIAAVASVAAAAQRSDLGTLAAIGYKPRKLWGYLLAQQTGLGLIAGVLGALVSWPVARLMGAHIPFSRALLAIPIATLLTSLAALPSALAASRTYPLALLKPQVRAPKRAFPVTGAINHT